MPTANVYATNMHQRELTHTDYIAKLFMTWAAPNNYGYRYGLDPIRYSPVFYYVNSASQA